MGLRESYYRPRIEAKYFSNRAGSTRWAPMRNNMNDKFHALAHLPDPLSKIFSLGSPVKIFPTSLRVMPLATLAAVAGASYFTVPPEARS